MTNKDVKVLAIVQWKIVGVNSCVEVPIASNSANLAMLFHLLVACILKLII